MIHINTKKKILNKVFLDSLTVPLTKPFRDYQWPMKQLHS